jgi:cytochrome c nitrite reductase small subunit
MGRSRSSSIAAATLIGVALVLGAYALHHTGALSYASDDPRACAGCHVMVERFEGWQKGPHHVVATCNDCHVPHDLVGKWLAKARNGFHHVPAFLFEDVHEPIRITPRNAAALQAGCLHCHGDFVRGVGHAAGGELACAGCHRAVGHGSGESGRSGRS